MRTTWRTSLVTLALAAAGIWTLQALGLTVVQVRGPSMSPTLKDGQVLFVNRLAYGIQGPIIGDYLWIWKGPLVDDPVVVRRSDTGQLVVKRVAGLPGANLRVEDHRLVLGDRRIPLTPAQEYWLSSCPRVPEGSYFVLGDNLSQSLDSRDWGFVRQSDVLGRALL